jgi:hypothetical protein
MLFFSATKSSSKAEPTQVPPSSGYEASSYIANYSQEIPSPDYPSTRQRQPRTDRRHRRRSIYTSQPSIAERESSLYPTPHDFSDLYALGQFASYNQSTMSLLYLPAEETSTTTSTRAEAKLLPNADRIQTTLSSYDNSHKASSEFTFTSTSNNLRSLEQHDRDILPVVYSLRSGAKSASNLYTYLRPLEIEDGAVTSEEDYDDDTASTDGSSPCTPQSSSRATSVLFSSSTPTSECSADLSWEQKDLVIPPKDLADYQEQPQSTTPRSWKVRLGRIRRPKGAGAQNHSAVSKVSILSLSPIFRTDVFAHHTQTQPHTVRAQYGKEH